MHKRNFFPSAYFVSPTSHVNSSIPVSRGSRWHHFVQKNVSRPTSPFTTPNSSISKRANSLEERFNCSLLSSNSHSIQNAPFQSTHSLRRTFSSHVSHNDFVHNAPIQLPSCISLETGERLQLPHSQSSHDAIKRITSETLVDLLNGKYTSIVDEFVIIDCRFLYEFEGGHIDSAVNISSIPQIEQFIAQTADCFQDKKHCKVVKRALIFHCEYSSFRAPRMALYVRKMDRKINASSYPQLSFPEMYILEGGYRQFFQHYPIYCSPRHYVEMEHEPYKKESARLLNQFKTSFSDGKKSKTICSFNESIQFISNGNGNSNIAIKDITIFSSSDIASDDMLSFEELCHATTTTKRIDSLESNNVFC